MADIKIETYLRWDGLALRIGSVLLGWVDRTKAGGWGAACFEIRTTDLPDRRTAREWVEARVLERLGAKRIGEVGHD